MSYKKIALREVKTLEKMLFLFVFATYYNLIKCINMEKTASETQRIFESLVLILDELQQI